MVNKSRSEQNGQYFADDIFEHIFLQENLYSLFQISLKFVPQAPINSKSSLVQVMAWCQAGTKPLPETNGDQVQRGICVTRRLLRPSDPYMRQ